MKYYYFKIKSGTLSDITFAIDSTKAETLVFGSSHANHDYVPDVFRNRLHTSFYNCGSDATGLVYEAALLNAITARYKPKRILLDILPYEFSLDESDRLSKLLPYKDNPRIYPYLAQISPYEHIKLLSQSYPFNSLVTSVIIRNLRNNKQEASPAGYSPLTGTIDYPDTSVLQEKSKIIYKKVAIFDNLLKRLDQLEIPVYVIISPLYIRSAQTESEKITSKFCERYKNIHFVSFINDPKYLQNDEWFKDFGHLNNDGATKFSHELSSYIINEETNNK
ncbi:hypothetical protein EFY79_08870 [Hanamia caeni]|uniref:SGNH/GDSL hydrolase family protein n=1 Tax=Hanamia caeni TaxID=2294116 RepID=A0A3M9NI96_9BACT|nr:hypothetical protein EFY79_08870 [Hanamia caeni]